MKIENIKKNILYLLAFEWNDGNTDKEFPTRRIYEMFSDIPDGHIARDIETMNNQGLVYVSSDQECISITKKGLSILRENLPSVD